ncbi:MAG: glycosyltransferase family 39 protein [Kiritimatiellae bacterium]|nr:glycosyltransferase family 39 protein [Kiritimatiellia bacterium]
MNERPTKTRAVVGGLLRAVLRHRALSAWRVAELLLVGLLAAHAVLAVRHVLVTLAHPYPVEYGEGVVLNWVDRANRGAALYPPVSDTPPYLHNPYPPVYYWLAGAGQRAVPAAHPFFAGRLLACLCWLMACGAVAWMVRRRMGTRGAAGAALLLLFSPVALRYACMVRVDFLGLAFALCGLALVSGRDSPARAAAAGIACAAALLTKPVLFAAPAACGIVVLRQGRRNTVRFAAGFLLCLAAGVGWLCVREGGGWLPHLFDLNRLPFQARRLFFEAAPVFGRHPFLLAGIVFFVARNRKTRDAVWWYVLFAVAGTALFAKVGAAENYFLEFIAAGALACGWLATALGVRGREMLLWCLLAQLTLYLPVKAAPVFTRTYGQELPESGLSATPTRVDAEVGAVLLGELRTADGPVLCDDLGFLLLAGKAVVVQAFQYGHLAAAGRWDDARLCEAVRDGQFELVVVTMDARGEAPAYFTPGIFHAVEQHYALRRMVGKYRVYERP